MFVRTTKKELEKTTTYKFKKTVLRKESFNPIECAEDRLYYFNAKEKKFLPVDADIYNQIQAKTIRF